MAIGGIDGKAQTIPLFDARTDPDVGVADRRLRSRRDGESSRVADLQRQDRPARTIEA
jgi:hypothetical protein